MIESLRKEIYKATDECNKVCDELAMAKAEKWEKEIRRLELEVEKKIYYREGLIKALNIVSKEMK